MLGCSTTTRRQGRELNTLYFETVVPESLFLPPRNASQLFIQSTSGLRYALYAGNVSVDDVCCILPFRDHFFAVRRQPAQTLVELIALLNAKPPPMAGAGRAARLHRSSSGSNCDGAVGALLTDGVFYDSYPHLASVPGPKIFDLIVVSFDLPFVTAALAAVTGADKAAFDIAPYRAEEDYTDTAMFTRWANATLGAPCSPRRD